VKTGICNVLKSVDETKRW